MNVNGKMFMQGRYKQQNNTKSVCKVSNNFMDSFMSATKEVHPQIHQHTISPRLKTNKYLTNGFLNKDDFTRPRVISVSNVDSQKKAFSTIDTNYTMGELKQIWNDSATVSKQSKNFERRAKKDLINLKKQLKILGVFVDTSIQECKILQRESEKVE